VINCTLWVINHQTRHIERSLVYAKIQSNINLKKAITNFETKRTPSEWRRKLILTDEEYNACDQLHGNPIKTVTQEEFLYNIRVETIYTELEPILIPTHKFNLIYWSVTLCHAKEIFTEKDA
jgi:copper oxidase (laccase) domain-containing protein